MWRNGNVVFFGWSSLGFDSRVILFWIFEPHSKNHSKGAKISQIHSKYSESRMCISLCQLGPNCCQDLLHFNCKASCSQSSYRQQGTGDLPL